MGGKKQACTSSGLFLCHKYQTIVANIRHNTDHVSDFIIIATFNPPVDPDSQPCSDHNRLLHSVLIIIIIFVNHLNHHQTQWPWSLWSTRAFGKAVYPPKWMKFHIFCKRPLTDLQSWSQGAAFYTRFNLSGLFFSLFVQFSAHFFPLFKFVERFQCCARLFLDSRLGSQIIKHNYPTNESLPQQIPFVWYNFFCHFPISCEGIYSQKKHEESM